MAIRKTKTIKSTGLSEGALLASFRKTLAHTFQACFPSSARFSLSTSLALKSFGLSVQSVMAIVAVFAERDSIGNVIAKFGKVGPLFNVMRGEFPSTNEALLAGVVVFLKYGSPPKFVLIPISFGVTLISVAFISRMKVSALKVRSRFPFVRFRPRFNCLKHLFSFCGIAPSADQYFAGHSGFSLRCVRAPLATIFRLATDDYFDSSFTILANDILSSATAKHRAIFNLFSCCCAYVLPSKFNVAFQANKRSWHMSSLQLA